jgi:hypothetical protein
MESIKLTVLSRNVFLPIIPSEYSTADLLACGGRMDFGLYLS